jgi:hypothetical protein
MLDADPVGETKLVRRGDETSQRSRWRQAHEELTRLAAKKAHLDREELRWLVVAAREGTHVRLGYATFVEYIEWLFGYSPRFTLERLRVGEALEKLPEMSRALGDGAFPWSAVRELTRVATSETEAEWLQAVRGKTAREVERLVSRHARGSRPNDEPDPALRRHVIRLEVSGESYALFRDALAQLRRDAGEPLDDDTTALLLARSVLQGPADDGRASYQVSLSVCQSCRRSVQRGKGESIEVDATIVDMASCDAQRLAFDGITSPAPRPKESVDKSTHVGRGRATQAIPPSIRRQVLERDGRRCRVPGCRHATFVDLHHVTPRAEGGSNGAENLITLCGAHHRATHRGALLIERRDDDTLRFLHSDGSDYGAGVSPAVVDARAKAFRALLSLGFRETESKRALERAMQEVNAPNVESLLRLALRELVQAA